MLRRAKSKKTCPRQLRRTFFRALTAIIFLIAGAGCSNQESKDDSPDPSMMLLFKRQVSAENLVRTIRDLENFKTRYSWEKQRAVADYLVKRLEMYGLQSSIDDYVHHQKIWHNVIVTLPGRKLPTQIYMIIAHYDSISEQAELYAPGADDNATGVAAAIEIARILKESSLDSTVQIAFFSNEEQGHLGSKHFAKRARSENQDLRGIINLDVIGYNNPLGSIEDESARGKSLLNHVKQRARKLRNYAFSKLYPNGRVTVAGRPANRELVRKTAGALKKFTDLNVVAEIDDDCG
jgi:hypothetical protein